MGYEFPGDKNTNGYKKFRFVCTDKECVGAESFHGSMEEVPEYVPSSIDCPFGGDHQSKWIVDKAPAIHIKGGETSTHMSNPHYNPERADQEHRWMESQIEETRRALRGEDQLTGKAANPYGKWTLNHDEALKRGVIKKASQEQAEERTRIMDERSKIIMDQASDKLTDIERQHAGRRHDG